MQPSFRIHSRLISLFPIVILSILCGCTPNNVVPSAEIVVLPTATQSQVVTTEAEPTTSSQSNEPQSPAGLTVVESTVKVFRSTEVPQDQTVGVQMNDLIEVNPDSRSFLNFPDFLEVEIFRNAKVLIADVKQESGGSTEVTLNLRQGHIFVRLNDQANSRVTVVTPFSTIKALENGTDFDVCHNERLTCVLVKKGLAEVTALDKQQILKAGEASYINIGQTPSPAICAPLEIFDAWEENYRAKADTPALGKMVSDLPQEPCPPTIMEVPSDAIILYEDDFTNPSSGWLQGTFDNYLAGYSESEYYYFQILSPEDKFSVPIPSREKYVDVNIDLAVSTESAQSGDFRYGIVFRRSGDQYYAFAISPSTKMWYVLKSSSSGTALETLKEGTEASIQGLEDADGLRVTTKDSTFFFYINGRPVGEVSDPDYSSGEVGLFVETLDSPEARIRFDSIVLWNTQAPQPNPTIGAENCFNNKDDDGDALVDRADPDCERQGGSKTPTSVPPTTYP